MVLKNIRNDGHFLGHLNNSVVERILVLLKPAGQIVGDGGGVVDHSKVRVRVGPLVGDWS